MLSLAATKTEEVPLTDKAMTAINQQISLHVPLLQLLSQSTGFKAFINKPYRSSSRKLARTIFRLSFRDFGSKPSAISNHRSIHNIHTLCDEVFLLGPPEAISILDASSFGHPASNGLALRVKCRARFIVCAATATTAPTGARITKNFANDNLFCDNHHSPQSYISHYQ